MQTYRSLASLRFERYKPWFVGEGRLRSGWRVALYIAASFLLLTIFQAAFILIVSWLWASRGISDQGIQALFADFSARPFNYPDIAFSFIIIRTAVTLGLIWLFRRRIDKRPILTLGFQLPVGWWRELGAGFAFSFIGWLAIFLLSLAFGGAAIVGFAWNDTRLTGILGALALGLVFNLLVGVTEEADARGYILQNLAEGTRLVPAILISSFYFGAVHLLNPGAGWLSTLGIFFAGILLAMGYYVTQRLWFSIGMHAAWNFAEGSVFGFMVSGLDMGGLVRAQITGPGWLMGGLFGPEAGALAVAVEIAMIGLLIAWKHGRLEEVKNFLSVFFWMR